MAKRRSRRPVHPQIMRLLDYVNDGHEAGRPFLHYLASATRYNPILDCYQTPRERIVYDKIRDVLLHADRMYDAAEVTGDRWRDFRECPHCGWVFFATHDRQRFCSDACRKA